MRFSLFMLLLSCFFFSASAQLHATYFLNRDLAGTPAWTGFDDQVNHRDCILVDGTRTCDVFSIHWSGYLVSPITGTVTFYLTLDDGGQLSIGGQSVIDQWKLQAPTEYRNNVYMNAGEPLSIDVTYFENYGQSVCVLEWESAQWGRQVVPASAFLPTVASIAINPPYAELLESTMTTLEVSLTTRPDGATSLALVDVDGVLSISACSLEFDENTWNVPQLVQVALAPSYSSISKPVSITFEVTASVDVSYRGVSNSFTALRRPISIAQCTAWGDPHFTSFDGLKYNYYGVGEFVLFRTFDASYVVQSQLRPCGGRGASCSFATAVKMQDSAFFLSVDAVTGVPSVRVLSDAIADGVSVTQSGRTYTFAFGSIELKVVIGYWAGAQTYYLNHYVTVPGSAYGAVSGLCGSYDGNSANDIGVSLDTFGELHRVVEGQSIFQWPDTSIPPMAVQQETVTVSPAVLATLQSCTAPLDTQQPTTSSSTEPPTAVDLTSSLVEISASLPPLEDEFTSPFVPPLDYVPVYQPLFENEQESLEAEERWQAILESPLALLCANISVDVTSYRDVFLDEAALCGDSEAAAVEVMNALAEECRLIGSQQQTMVQDGVMTEPEDMEAVELLLQSVVSCPNGCSLRGQCVDGACACDGGFSGNDCSVPVVPAAISSCVHPSGDALQPEQPFVCSGNGLDIALTCVWENADNSLVIRAPAASSQWSARCDVPAHAYYGNYELRIEAEQGTLHSSTHSIGPLCEESACVHLLHVDDWQCMGVSAEQLVTIGVFAAEPHDVSLEAMDVARQEFYGLNHLSHPGADTWTYHTVAVPVFELSLGADMQVVAKATHVASNTLSTIAFRSLADLSCNVDSWEHDEAQEGRMYLVDAPRIVMDGTPFDVTLGVESSKNCDLHVVLMQRNTWTSYASVRVPINASTSVQQVVGTVDFFRNAPSSIPTDLVLNVFLVASDGEWADKRVATRFYVTAVAASCEFAGGCIDTSPLPAVLPENGPAIRLRARVFSTVDADVVFGVMETKEYTYFGGSRTSVSGSTEWQEVEVVVRYREGLYLPDEHSVIDVFLTPPGKTWREKTVGVKKPVAVARNTLEAGGAVHVAHEMDCALGVTSFTFSVVSTRDVPFVGIAFCVDVDWVTRDSLITSYSIPEECRSSMVIENGVMSFSCARETSSSYWSGVFHFELDALVGQSAGVITLEGADVDTAIGAISMSECGTHATTMTQAECENNEDVTNGGLTLVSDCSGVVIAAPCASPQRGCLTIYSAPSVVPVFGDSMTVSVGVFTEFSRELVLNVMAVTAEDGWQWMGGVRKPVSGGLRWEVLTFDVEMVRDVNLAGAKVVLDTWLVEEGGDWTKRNMTVTLPLAVPQPNEVAGSSVADGEMLFAGDECAVIGQDLMSQEDVIGCLSLNSLVDALSPLDASEPINVEVEVLSPLDLELTCDILAWKTPGDTSNGVDWLGGSSAIVNGSSFGDVVPLSIVTNVDRLPIGSFWNCFLSPIGEGWGAQVIAANKDIWLREVPSAVRLPVGEIELPLPIGTCTDAVRGCIDTTRVSTNVPSSGPFKTRIQVNTAVETELVVSLIRKQGAVLHRQFRAVLEAQSDWQQVLVSFEDLSGIPTQGMELNVYLTPVGSDFRSATSKNTLDVGVCA